MRIFVVGNINSGKSFVVNKLRYKYPDYPILSIDEFRIKFSKGTIETEEETRKKFANAIIKNKDAIIEYSGGNTITSLFIDKLRINSVVVLEVQENVEICIERIKSKDFSKIPYPVYNESIAETIRRLDNEFKDNCIEKNFKDKILYKFNINSDDTIDQYPLEQLEHTIKLIDEFESKYDCIFAFGSLGRRQMQKYSDVDLFIRTNNSIDHIKNEISNLFPKAKIIIQNKQIDIYIDSSLIEINFIKNIIDAQLFYKKSEITEVKKTILLGNNELEFELNSLLDSYKENFKDEFIYTISRLQYYLNSLPRLILKKDIYKYYFHNNIIIHEYVKLNYLMAGNRKYSYLPRYAYKLLDPLDWDKLIYTFNKNQEDHYNIVKDLVGETINKANEYLENL